MRKWEIAGETGRACVGFLRVADMSAGVYRLAAGAEDGQSPHGEDELYFVIRGRARFRSGGEDVAVSAGDCLFVFGPAVGTRSGQ
jgi:mannose-6-phosphate isomerase-like protein (cupin superfamily)